MGNIYTVGETTYDIVFRNGQPTGAVVGGSMLNTSVALGRLKMPVVFISRIGNDKVGELSVKFLHENGVDCSCVSRFAGNSRLALAFMDDKNNATYQFYNERNSSGLSFPVLSCSDVVVFGSTNALTGDGRNEFLEFLENASQKKILTVYDPNIRETDPVKLIEVRQKFEENLRFSKVVKGSDEDFIRLYNTTNISEIFEWVKSFGVEALIVTAGSKPIELRTAKLAFSLPVEVVNVVSTIGAGDNFTAGLVFCLMSNEMKGHTLSMFDESLWLSVIKTASSFSADVCLSESNYISIKLAEKFQ